MISKELVECLLGGINTVKKRIPNIHICYTVETCSVACRDVFLSSAILKILKCFLFECFISLCFGRLFILEAPTLAYILLQLSLLDVCIILQLLI